jgi:hypothetical protein
VVAATTEVHLPSDLQLRKFRGNFFFKKISRNFPQMTRYVFPVVAAPGARVAEASGKPEGFGPREDALSPAVAAVRSPEDTPQRPRDFGEETQKERSTLE